MREFRVTASLETVWKYRHPAPPISDEEPATSPPSAQAEQDRKLLLYSGICKGVPPPPLTEKCVHMCACTLAPPSSRVSPLTYATESVDGQRAEIGCLLSTCGFKLRSSFTD